MDFILLIISLFVILFSSELFTNGIESFGKSLSLSQAVVGSVLAAVGTALPETIVPLVAILLYKGKEGSYIGVGAILGAPFMLSTIGLFLIGIGVYLSYFFKKRKKLKIYLESSTVLRDFSFFLLSYSLAIFFPLIFPNTRTLHYIIAVILILNYIIYVFITFKSDSLELESVKELYLNRIVNSDSNHRPFLIFMSFFQVILALILMIKGAHIFVENLENISKKLGIDPLLFALILSPVATELPEKCNSFLWTLRGKDILALGNITGAMVFQATFPVSVGLLFTSWKIKGLALFSALITLFLGIFYMFVLKISKKLPPYVFFISGFFYLFYIYLIIRTLAS